MGLFESIREYSSVHVFRQEHGLGIVLRHVLSLLMLRTGVIREHSRIFENAGAGSFENIREYSREYISRVCEKIQAVHLAEHVHVAVHFPCQIFALTSSCVTCSPS